MEMNNKFVRSQDGCTMFRVRDVERIEILYNDDTSICDRLKNLVSGEHKEPESSWYEIMFFFDMNLEVLKMTKLSWLYILRKKWLTMH